MIEALGNGQLSERLSQFCESYPNVTSVSQKSTFFLQLQDVVSALG